MDLIIILIVLLLLFGGGGGLYWEHGRGLGHWTYPASSSPCWSLPTCCMAIAAAGCSYHL